MNTLFFTLLVSFAIIVICVSLLGISMLLTGKSKLRIGMCGRVPTKKRSKDAGCGMDYSCSICGKGKEDKQETE